MLQNIGRNAACPCRSGKKYKRCCLPKDELAARTAPPGLAVELDGDDIDELSNFALHLIRERRFAEAEIVCRELQATFPDQIDGLDRLAHLREAQGRREEAARLYRNAARFAETHDGFDPEGIAWFNDQAERLERAP